MAGLFELQDSGTELKHQNNTSQNDDKRSYKRHNYSAPISFEYHRTSNYYPGVMLNHSMGGMCFISQYALPKGLEIYIKMKNYSPAADGPESRKGYRAMVKWCKKNLEKAFGSYEIGVNFFEPVLY